MTATCDDMDEENPEWLEKCTAEPEEWSTTDLTGPLAIATYTRYSDSSCTTVLITDEWTDAT